MKKPSFALLLFLAVQGLLAQDATKISTYLDNGDTSSLMLCLGDEIDLALPGIATQLYLKGEAKEQLKSFFAQYPLANFSAVHSGKSKAESSYGVGNFSSGDKRFRITYYLNGSESTSTIRQLRIVEL